MNNKQQKKFVLFVLKNSGSTITCPTYVPVKMEAVAVMLCCGKKRPNSSLLPWVKIAWFEMLAYM